MIKEIWKEIPGYEGFYEASTFGRIRSINRRVLARNGEITRRGSVLTGFVTKWGYRMVSLRYDKKFTVHSLVALTFIGERPQSMDVNHKNGVKTDNSVENLEYLSRSDNHTHAYRNGLKARAVLDMGKAREIRRLYQLGGMTHKQIALKFGVGRPNVSSVIRGAIWKEKS